MNELEIFNKEFGKMRIFTSNKEIEVVAKDLCEILGLGNVTMTLRSLDDDEKGVKIIETLGGNQEVNIVNEFGLYTLILKSRKPEAKKFKRWVTHEVLPTIRKFGCYPRPELTQEVSNEHLKLQVIGTELMISSKDLAEMFNKKHNTVMRDIVSVFNFFRKNKDDFEKGYFMQNGFRKTMYYMNKVAFELVTARYCEHPNYLKLRQYYLQAFSNYELMNS